MIKIKNEKYYPVNYSFLTKVNPFLTSNHTNIISKKHESSNFHINFFYKKITPKF
jgi:hypothetical protein